MIRLVKDQEAEVFQLSQEIATFIAERMLHKGIPDNDAIFLDLIVRSYGMAILTNVFQDRQRVIDFTIAWLEEQRHAE